MASAEKPDIDSGPMMAAHFSKKSKECIDLSSSFQYAGALLVAEETIEDYLIYKAKKIPIDGEDLFSNLEQNLKSYDASFQLLVIQFQMRCKVLEVEDIDMQSFKDLLIMAHKLEESLDLLRLIVENFSFIFLSKQEIKIARVFLMLTIDCIDHKVNDFEVIEGRNKLRNTFAMLFAELHFLSGYSMLSVKLLKSQPENQETHEARELIFSDVLDTLGTEDVYPSLPDVAQNIEQAKQLFDIMEEKIHDLELVMMECSVEGVPGPTATAPLFARFWRGQIHHDFSYYQEDPQELMKMAEKSMQLWNPFLAESFTKAKLRLFARSHPNDATYIFTNMTERNRRNFQEIISFKATAIMDSDPEDASLMPSLYELNLLRKDYILQMVLYMDFFDMINEILPNEALANLNEQIALQYRSIILKNQKKDKQNLDNSIPYILKYKGMVTLGWPILPSSAVNLLCDVVDQDPFIQKFRKKQDKFEDHMLEEYLKTLELNQNF